MDTVESSADNTDREENFEDANSSRLDSKPESAEPSEKSPDSGQISQRQSQASTVEPKSNGDVDVRQTSSMPDTDPVKRTSSAVESLPPEGDTPTPATIPDDPPKPSVQSIATSLEGKEDNTPMPPPKPQSRPSRFGNFSASLPAVPWGSASTDRRKSDARAPSPQPPTQSGKQKSTPFGWFSRASTATTPKDSRSPPPPDMRRNTAASISTIGSNPELSMKAFEDGDGRPPARQSLKEKFKMLRLQEEVGIRNLDEPNEAKDENNGTVGLGIETPTDGDQTAKPPATPMSPTTPSTNVNPGLAPGTVSGFSTSATDASAPIDWDFWQTVVNEGPQAVSRTSPEELAAAIASGVPQTIRGVIWQVLAGSKNDDLESVYFSLKAKGTDRDSKELPVSLNGVNGNAKERSVSSSRSSTRSERSTPATSANGPVGSPSPSTEMSDPIKDQKLQVQLAAEKAKKAKDDAAALAKLEKMIKRDMGSRTSYSKYTTAAGLQDALFNVCKAYALFDSEVGYPQGMNFIIMPLLFTMSEEEAFCLLVRLMNKYQIRDLFVADMPGLHLHLYQFERLLEDAEPALYCHLNRRGVSPKLYATQWFLTLFAYRFPLQLVMRVYDLLLCEGLEGAILKFGMAVMQRNVQTLLSMNDMQALTTFLKEKVFDVYIDRDPSSRSMLDAGFFGNSAGSDNEVYRADLIVRDASAIKLTPQMLNRYREEWEERTTSEKARETELENLRTDTVTKASQIRSLEQRAEKSDAEHIEIANELVKLKVENTELSDRNESLNGQVEELRKVAESEAKNVEERLREGMEQVMQRNVEVQNENRHMEEQMAEMERELVEMKMKFAELNADHEGLKQKWNDLRKALD
ncbi:uncharacterized protein HMPREF1541_07591 [Cyphellophora europaea CBS 101466]|uniref:GTPase-activating protein GYP5 n=1 Tax=Cyphellophora europaea (strain CBS 101466) TaxID=1220924 RepID=W2RQJ0_CYPE1|nr:uncharacterized protein HMPREF1541_07591 [Cyphellophora europaea CBS 101466]ETN37968.1 hypothetical protein HMPREF1541_07591 [Cyphellophora europaea CBS 101466]